MLVYLIIMKEAIALAVVLLYDVRESPDGHSCLFEPGLFF